MSKNTKDITEILSNYKNIKNIQMNTKNKTQKGGVVDAVALVGAAGLGVGKFVSVGIFEILRRFFIVGWLL